MKGMRQNIYADFRKEYPNLNINFRRSGGIFHDRYIILDHGTEKEKIFLCGSSSKDAGSRVTSILEDYDRGKYEAIVFSHQIHYTKYKIRSITFQKHLHNALFYVIIVK